MIKSIEKLLDEINVADSRVHAKKLISDYGNSIIDACENSASLICPKDAPDRIDKESIRSIKKLIK